MIEVEGVVGKDREELVIEHSGLVLVGEQEELGESEGEVEEGVVGG